LTKQQKISFSVENAEMISENPDSNFAVISLDFFASGENLHNMYVSEDTLMRTSSTIRNCPLIWKYDEKRDDIGTHDKEEVPCGFVPESSEIKSREMEDGRKMLSVIAYAWKRYTGTLLDIFKRDGGQKPVSVEMSVYDIIEHDNGQVELKDFKYEGITVLGSSITPAIPLANASVISFADVKKEYNEAVKKEFSLYNDVDMTIPKDVKENAKKGLTLKKETGKGGNSVTLSLAKHIVVSKTITSEKIKYITENFPKKKNNSDYDINCLLLGGVAGLKWSEATLEKLEEKDLAFEREELIKTEEKEKIAMAKKKDEKLEEEIDTTLEANTEVESFSEGEEKVEDAEGVTDNTETEEFAEGEKDNTTETEEFSEEEETEEVTEEFSEEEKTEESDEEFAEEKDEEAKGEKEEEDKKDKFEFPFSVEAMTALFAEDEEEEIKMAVAEMSKEFSSPAIIMGGMFCKMLKMAQNIKDVKEENKTYMEENEQLKKYKASIEEQQKFARIDEVLVELGERVVIPEESLEEFRASAEKYSFENLNIWETECKAKSFDFSVKDGSKDGVKRVGLAFNTNGRIKPKDDIWNGTK